MMRLRHLSLDRFGHFGGLHLDFGAQGTNGDFHIVHGPNEAGKTTVMEGFLRLLYGFPQREPYDFLHQRKNLQVSAELEIDGAERGFVRLPTRAGALTDDAGTPLPETALAAHLGGLSVADYRALLCLDDATIERGGEDIVNARGDTGRLLFSAAAGVSDLSAVLDTVRAEADALWRKQARKTRMADLKRELSEVETTIRDSDLSAAKWRRLQQARDTSQRQEEEARRDRDALRRTHASLAARRMALPLLTELDQLDTRLHPLRGYPVRLDIDPAHLTGLLAAQTRARGDAERLEQEIADARKERDALCRDAAAEELATELDALDPLRARYLSADPDLPKRRRALDAAKAAMAQVARDMGHDGDPAALVPSHATLSRLESARDRLQAARRAAEMEDAECAALAERLAQAEAALAETAGAAATPVADLLDRFAADRLAPDHATACEALAAARAHAQAALDALSRPGAPVAAVQDCPETERDAAARADRHAALCRDIAQGRAERDRYREEAAVQEAEIDRLSRSGPLVRDAEAADARAERDARWQAHLAALDMPSAERFEAAMHAFDALSAARLDRAQDLGALRAAERAAGEARTRAEAAAGRLEQLEADRKATEADAAAMAARAGLDALPDPAGWRDWVEAHGAALQAARAEQTLQERHRATLDAAARLSNALRDHLGLEAAAFETVLATARRRATEERRRAETTRDSEKARARLAAEHDRRQVRRDAARQTAAEAESSWRAAVSEAFGGSLDPDTLLVSLDPLHHMREHDAARAQALRQVEAMEADRAQFATRVAALAEACGLAAADTPPETWHRLRNHARAAAWARDRHAALTRLIETKTGESRAALARLAEIDHETERLAAVFPPGSADGDLEALRNAVARAQEAIELRDRRAALERRLLTTLDAADPDAARTALDGATDPELKARIEAVERDLDGAERRVSEAVEARVGAERDLDAVTGDAEIALLTERKAVLELQIEEAALQHLSLSFGHRLADEAIRRYRDTHRSAMMRATEAAFADLTAGAYTALRSRADGVGETLLAMDHSGAAKQVQDLSKGTRFQLYLALRAAAHAQMAGQGLSLPFFCDDIFETFDEDRTRAACRVMERIGRSGQAVYLTHHRHVVEIAREVCDSVPRIHELPARQ